MKTTSQIIKSLQENLNAIEVENHDVLLKAEQGIDLSKKAYNRLKDIVSDKQFKSKEQEIHFFKSMKPQVCSRLIFYVKLFNIESKKPRGSDKSQLKYLRTQLDKLQGYFNENLEFYEYYRRNSNFLDQQYFLRGEADIRLHPETYHYFSDGKFSTSHDGAVANIMAYDMLMVYLKTEIEKLRNKKIGIQNSVVIEEQSNLNWTGSKTDLIELIYALHSCGVINDGEVEIKELAMMFEERFNIQLGDYYRTYLEIRQRKIHVTKFTDKLKESLVKRMEECDQ